MDELTSDILHVLQSGESRKTLLDQVERRTVTLVRLGQLDAEREILESDGRPSNASKVHQQIKRCEQQLGMRGW